MITTTRQRVTGERPQPRATPDSLLALHDAGYRAVVDRLGPGRVLDVGCGLGFASVRLAGGGRRVVGVDYDPGATAVAAGIAPPDLVTGCMDALALGLAGATFDAACSSHLIEHFAEPERHVAEVARVLADGGTAYFLTPNRPADFENPFHVHLFGRPDLGSLLGRWFDQVWVGGVDATEAVKTDFALRRTRAARLLSLDVFDVRHKVPRRWYLTAYTHLLPVAYRMVARHDTGGATGISADDWFVTERVDDTTPVLFAVCQRPRRRHRPEGPSTEPPSTGAPV